MKKSLIITLFVLTFPAVIAQYAGETVYNFLTLTNSARVAALGGDIVSLADNDLNLVFHNPAILSQGMNQHMNVNYVNYYAGINYGNTSYAFHKKNIGTFSGGIHYIDYGTFIRADEYGNVKGNFYAYEIAGNMVYSRSIIDSVLSVGINFKPIYSLYERYNSFGVAADIGALYTLKATNTSFGLVASNFGVQLLSFDGTREKLPFELKAGITQGLQYAPFRFHIQLRHLEKWDLTYEKEDEEIVYFGGETGNVSRFDIIADKLMRHAVFGVELLLGENFHIDLGYNYRRRQEMKMSTRPGMIGFSWGVGFRISRFHVSYGRSRYHLAGGTNHFSITTDLSTFFRSSNKRLSE